MADIDTGVASVPAARPSVFTPPQWYAPAVENSSGVGVPSPATSGTSIVRPPAAGDYASGTQAAATANCVDDITGIAVTASPGY